MQQLLNQNRSKTQKCSNFSTKCVVKFLTRNVVICQPEVYQQNVDTLLVERLLHFWVLLRFWFKSCYISWFLLRFWFKSYYVSGFTTLLIIYYRTFLGLTWSKTDHPFVQHFRLSGIFVGKFRCPDKGYITVIY